MPESSDSDPFWLDHRDRRNYSGFGRFPSRRERERDKLLRDWYGEEFAREEIMARRRPCQPLQESVADLIKQLGRSRSFELHSLQQDWPAVVGTDLAKRTRPVFLRDGVLTVEVSQPTWLYALRTSGLAEMNRCVAKFTDGKVASVRLVPGGHDRGD